MSTKARLLFLLSCGGLGFLVATNINERDLASWWIGFLIGAGAGLLAVGIELSFTRRLATEVPTILAGLAGGVLCTLFASPGLVLARAIWGLEDQYLTLMGVGMLYIFTYLCLTVIYQTRDRFLFHVPFLDLRRGDADPAPLIVDTSAIIDGRLPEVCASGVFEGGLVVPRFVLEELQRLADSPRPEVRLRGRFGLDRLEALRREDRVPLRVQETGPDQQEADARLLALTEQLRGRLLTNDTNLERVARIRGLKVISLNRLAEALKPVCLPGDELQVLLVREGEERDQGVGFLDSGVMVVVDGGRRLVGQEVRAEVRSSLQTSAGRMIFARLKNGS